MNLKTIVLLFSFSCCAGKALSPTEGRFRVSIETTMRMFNYQLHEVWQGYMKVEGDIPLTPVHIEAYIGEHLRFHWDGYLVKEQRYIPVAAPLTVQDYCWAIGKPKALDDPLNRFWSREPVGSQWDTYNVDEVEDAKLPTVMLSWVIKDLEEVAENRWEEGRVIAKTKYDVLLSCVDCDRSCSKTY